MVGALIRAAHELMGEGNKQARDFAVVVRTSIELFAELPDGVLIEGVNDCDGHAAVLDLIDRWLAADPSIVWHPEYIVRRANLARAAWR